MYLSVDDIDRKCPRQVDRNNTEQWKTRPFDEICLRDFFQEWTALLRRYYTWEEWIYTFLYVLISALALIGNGVVILAVIRKREMRTARNVLIVNLALSNLMLAFTTIPFLWLPSIDFEFPYSNFFCKFANALPGSNIYCSTLTTSVIAIDRYYSVRTMKVVGPNGQSGQCLRAVLISVLIWIFSLMLSFPLLIYYQVSMLYVFKDVYVVNRFTNNSSSAHEIVLRSYGWRQCRFMAESEENSTTIPGSGIAVNEQMVQLGMSLMQAIMLYIVPLVVLSIFNVKLTRFLKKNAKQLKRAGSDDSHAHPKLLQKIQSDLELLRGKNLQKSNEMEKTSMAATGGRRRNSDYPRNDVQRRRNKTTVLLFSMAGSYAVLWFPFTFVSVLIDLELLKSGSPIMERIDQTCKLISIFSICVNPFLYGFLNTNFRREFNDIYTQCVQFVGRQMPFGFIKEERNAVITMEKQQPPTQSGTTAAYSTIVSSSDGMIANTSIRI